MNTLPQNIKDAIDREDYLLTEHAAGQLDKRNIPDWQVIAGMEDAVVLRERPNDSPFPVVEFEQALPDGTPVKTVWSWMAALEVANLVTVHYFNGDEDEDE